MNGATPFRGAVHGLLTFFASTYRDVFQFRDPPLHDPCAVAYVLCPEAFSASPLRVDVDLVSQLSPGRTVVDVFGVTGKPPNARVCRAMDVRAFWKRMHRALDAADAASPLNLQGRGEGEYIITEADEPEEPEEARQEGARAGASGQAEGDGEDEDAGGETDEGWEVMAREASGPAAASSGVPEVAGGAELRRVGDTWESAERAVQKGRGDHWGQISEADAAGRTVREG